MTVDQRERVRRKRIEFDRCTALLADAIARADRWYARREATLAAFDRDAKSAVGRLRADGRIQPSIVWDHASPA